MSEKEKEKLRAVTEGIARLDEEEYQYMKGYVEGLAHEKRKQMARQAAEVAAGQEGGNGGEE